MFVVVERENLRNINDVKSDSYQICSIFHKWSYVLKRGTQNLCFENSLYIKILLSQKTYFVRWHQIINSTVVK